MATGATFINDLMRWSQGNKGKLDALARQSVQELAVRTQVNTGPPVGPNIITGFLVGSWQPSVGAPAPPPRPGEREQQRAAAGGAALNHKDVDAELAIVVASMRVGDVFYYVNNAEYAMRQNYGFTGTDALGRNYAQAGKFFLQKTLAQWPQIVAEIAADLRMAPMGI